MEIYCVISDLNFINISFSGYVTHEAVVWSDVHNRWFFLPRRCSKESYNDVLDESRGCNVMITADDSFTDIKVCSFFYFIDKYAYSIQNTIIRGSLKMGSVVEEVEKRNLR